MTNASSFSRDANGIPVTRNGLQVSKEITFTTTGTVARILFHVTGTVEVLSLYGVVTTAMGNHTAAHWRINDQTIVTQVISLATGTTLTSLPAGTVITRRSLNTVALTASTAATGLVTDPVAATVPDFFMPFLVTQKAGGIQTDIEYVYTTSGNPTTGAITFYCGFIPLSSDGDVTAA